MNLVCQVDHRYLVDEDPRNLVLIKDLLSLPRKLTNNILSHPVIVTFVEGRWQRTKNMFLLSFILYLIFVLLFSSFMVMMYSRNNDKDNVIRTEVLLPQTCDALIPKQQQQQQQQQQQHGGGKHKQMSLRDDFEVDPEPIVVALDQIEDVGIQSRGVKGKNSNNNKKDDEYELHLEVVKVKKNKTKRSRANRKEGLFIGCSARNRYRDISLCTIEALLLMVILILLVLEAWQALALGKEYFLELENWFELLIITLAISTLCLKSELDILAIVASIGICLAWVELIFMFGRYPSLGGTFSIMYYSITKRIIKTALGLILLVVAFAFAFFIIHFDNNSEDFEDVPKSLVKSFVMVLGK